MCHNANRSRGYISGLLSASLAIHLQSSLSAKITASSTLTNFQVQSPSCKNQHQEKRTAWKIAGPDKIVQCGDDHATPNTRPPSHINANLGLPWALTIQYPVISKHICTHDVAFMVMIIQYPISSTVLKLNITKTHAYKRQPMWELQAYCNTCLAASPKLTSRNNRPSLPQQHEINLNRFLNYATDRSSIRIPGWRSRPHTLQLKYWYREWGLAALLYSK